MSAIYQQVNLYQPIFRKQRQIFSAMTMAQAGAHRRRRAHRVLFSRAARR